jgi:hypothetical protein
MIKLGTDCFDTGTGLPGMATHHQFELDGSKATAFQPHGLNPENGEPLRPFWVAPSRLQGEEIVLNKSKLPFQVLGTHVEDRATGFEGIAITLTLHLSGCAHFDVQPQGKHPKTGAPVKAQNFDYRRLKGPAIPDMTPAELAKSHVETPSPMDVEPRH